MAFISISVAHIRIRNACDAHHFWRQMLVTRPLESRLILVCLYIYDTDVDTHTHTLTRTHVCVFNVRTHTYAHAHAHAYLTAVHFSA